MTIAKAELWKVGQLKADDKIRFYPISVEQANELERQQIENIQNFAEASKVVETIEPIQEVVSTILAQREPTELSPKTVYRQAGDSYILLEYGENVLDLALRLRVHQLIQMIRDAKIAGVLELSPGVRSLQIKYDGLIIPQSQLIAQLLQLEKRWAI